MVRVSAETRYALSLGNETGYFAARRAPGPRAGNMVLLQPSFAYRHAERWRFSSSLAGLVSSYQETHARLRVRETFFGVAVGGVDLAAGKKIVRWGTGYAFTPTGVLDPPRVATDPADRLNLNEGREMVTADWIKGRHAVTFAYASGGLLQRHLPGMRETAAFRYNAMVAGFDTALIVAHDRGRRTLAGANFTRVFGEAIEVHGEWRSPSGCAHSLEGCATGSAVLLGGKYTAHSGWGAIAEYYTKAAEGRCSAGILPAGPCRLDAGVTRQHYTFARVSKSRLRELPGWKEWDVSASLVANMSDRSRVVVIDAERRVRNRFSFYSRAQISGGKKWQSEYGMIPYRTLISAGFRFQL